MKAATAIRKFMGQPGNNPEMTYTAVSVADIRDLKASCTDEEYQELGCQACKALGEDFEPAS